MYKKQERVQCGGAVEMNEIEGVVLKARPEIA